MKGKEKKRNYGKIFKGITYMYSEYREKREKSRRNSWNTKGQEFSKINDRHHTTDPGNSVNKEHK